MSDLREQAIKMGLQVGRKITVYYVVHRNKTQNEYKKKCEATVVNMYKHIFTVKQKGNGAIESFQYEQFVVTKELVLTI